MRKCAPLLVALFVLFSLTPAYGSVATAYVMEGDSLPGGPTGHAVLSINNTAVNFLYGYAATVNTSDGTNTLSHVWGNLSGGAGDVIRTEETIGNYEQYSYESFFGVSLLRVAYSPMCNDTLSGATGLDGVWWGDTPIMIKSWPYPGQPGWYWTFGSRPGVTLDNWTYWVGGITDTIGGGTLNRGLFINSSATPLLIGGGTVVGLPDTLDHASTVSFDYRFSSLGTHYIAEVQTVTGSIANNNHMVIDGAVIMAGGAPVSEAGAVPAVVGGLPGEQWDNFDYTGILGDGQYMFTGDTDAATTVDEIVVVDGAIVYREGDTLGSEVLSGAIEGAYMNNEGDIAFIWDIRNNTLEALFLNGVLLLKEGDEVDITGDLVPDAGVVITDFTGISALTLGNRDGSGNTQIYFTADVDVPASILTERERTLVASGDRDPLLGEAWGIDAVDAPESDRGAAKSGGRAVLEGFFVLDVPSDPTGIAGPAAEGAEEWDILPEARLLSVYPNPARTGETRIRLSLPGGEPVSLDLFNIAGRRVTRILSGDYPAGERTVLWNGLDSSGSPVAPGIYFLRCTSGDRSESKRIIIVK